MPIKIGHILLFKNLAIMRACILLVEFILNSSNDKHSQKTLILIEGLKKGGLL
jgi:hypothetical protein